MTLMKTLNQTHPQPSQDLLSLPLHWLPSGYTCTFSVFAGSLFAGSPARYHVFVSPTPIVMALCWPVADTHQVEKNPRPTLTLPAGAARDDARFLVSALPL